MDDKKHDKAESKAPNAASVEASDSANVEINVERATSSPSSRSPTTPKLIQKMEDYELVEIKENTKVVYYEDAIADEKPAWSNQQVLTPPAMDVDVGVRREGLSSEVAARALVAQARAILEEHQQSFEKKQASYLRLLWKAPESFLSVLVVLILVAFFVFIYVQHALEFSWIHPKSLLVEAFLVTSLYALNIWLFRRERKFTQNEVLLRAQDILQRLENSGLNTMQELRVPHNSAIAVARVIRDGVLRSFPFSLLVKGDIVEMTFGDKAPCKARYVFASREASETAESYFLEENQVFRPSLFGDRITPFMSVEFQLNRGRFQFELLETPMVSTLKASLENKRPDTMLFSQVKGLRGAMHRFAIVAVLLAVVFNVIRFAITEEKSITWFGDLLVLQVYILIPILPFTGILMWVVIRAYGNAKILALFEQLQQSNTPFDDREDVDEFDEEALPPTKDVKLASSALFRKFISLMAHEKQWMLTHSTNLLESLSSTTVICSVDRHGSIASPFPSVEEICFFTSDADELMVLDVTDDANTHEGPKFEDRDWRQSLASLKPMGLDLLLATNCGIRASRQRSEQHLKLNDLPLYCRCRPARETCLCALAKEMGFSEDAIETFEKVKEFYLVNSRDFPRGKTLRDDQFEVPSAVALLVRDRTTGNYMLFTEGSLELILKFCSDYWDGAVLKPMDESSRKKVTDAYQNATTNDMQCIAYSYTPILPSEELSSFLNVFSGQAYVEVTSLNTSPALQFINELLHGQIFLCMAALVHQPKEDVCDFIEDLRLAGIRFVYFSETAERESKAFAEELGIETDWNSCILLSSSRDPNSAGGYLEAHDIKAKLPRGIENIRPHLERVDDIPLHVSLFADCDPEAVEEMIRIFQENGEVVCCTGSALRHVNSASFALADVSIAIEPFHMKIHKPSKHGDHIPPFLLGSSLTSLPASLTMHFESSPYVLTQIIREARYFMIHLNQMFTFVAGCSVSIAMLELLSYMLFLPPIFMGFQVLWLVCVIVPLISISFIFSPYEAPDVMKLMPSKNKDHMKGFSREIGYFAGRFLPVVFLTFLIYVLCLSIYYPKPWPNTVPALASLGWLKEGSLEQWATIYAQNATLFVFVMYLVCVSSTFMFRTLYVWEFSPFRNLTWAICSLIAIFLQIGFSAAFLVGGPLVLDALSWIFGLAFVLPIVLVAIQEWVKQKEKKEFVRCQKRSKLEFNTKLGCYSPV